MKLTLHTFLSLDGVMQAPGGPDEDTSGGFTHGGWTFPYSDEDSGVAMLGWFGHASAFLLGRRTYEIFSGFWPRVTDPADPIAGKLNALPKYVASSTLASAGWHNSCLLGGDVPADVARLKELPGDELQVHGSGGLAQTLIEHDLIDEYRLTIFPVHLGRGKKLFGEGTRAAALRLVSTSVTGTGVIVATYVPDGPRAVRLIRTARPVVATARANAGTREFDRSLSPVAHMARTGPGGSMPLDPRVGISGPGTSQAACQYPQYRR